MEDENDLGSEQSVDELVRKPGLWKRYGHLIISAVLVLGIAKACSSCFSPKPDTKYVEYYQHDVDQVFRDHDGWRLYYDDEEGVVHEVKYKEETRYGRCDYGELPKDIPPFAAQKFQFISTETDYGDRIIKDLQPGTQGYAYVLKYEDYFMDIGWTSCEVTHVEIHLPKDASLSPGNETWGGKYKTHDSMKEVK